MVAIVIVALLIAFAAFGALGGYWLGRDTESKQVYDLETAFWSALADAARGITQPEPHTPGALMDNNTHTDIDLDLVAREWDNDAYDEWLEVGVKAGWVSKPYCSMHEVGPLRDWEEAEFDDCGDPCILVTRIWKDGYEDVTMETVVDLNLQHVEGKPE